MNVFFTYVIIFVVGFLLGRYFEEFMNLIYAIKKKEGLK